MTEATYRQSDRDQRTEWLVKGILTGQALPNAMEAALPQFAKNPAAWAGFLGRTSLGPLFYHRLKSAALLDLAAPEFLHPIEVAYRAATAHNIIFQEELFRIADLFHSRGIPLVPLKGSLLVNSVYSPIGVRPMIDIDVMVPQPRFLEAARILESEAGYKNRLDFLRGNPPPYPSGMQFIRAGSRPLTLELHWNIINPLSMKSRFLPMKTQRMLQSDIYNSLKPVDWRGHTLHVMSPEFTLLSLVYHHYTHNFLDGIWFLDVILALQNPETGISPDALAETAFRHGLGKLLFLHLDRCRLAWPTPPAVEVLYRETCSRLSVKPADSREAAPGAAPLSPSFIYTPRTAFITALHSLFVKKIYFETTQFRGLSFFEYISLYASHLSRVFSLASGREKI